MADRNPVPEGARNVGGSDRIARVILGVAMFAIAVYASTAGRQTLAVFGVIAGAGLLLNAATQFCGINAVLGLDTCEWNPDEN